MTTILYNPKANNGSGEASVRAWVAAHGEDPANMRSVLEIPDLAAFVAPLGADDKIILCGGDGTLMRFATPGRMRIRSSSTSTLLTSPA